MVMNKKQILHKDLKPQNILIHFPHIGNIAEDFENDVDAWIKAVDEAKLTWDETKPIEIQIADFGLAAQFTEDMRKIEENKEIY